MSDKFKNDIAWEKLFEVHHILDEINKKGIYEISAKSINQVREARLMTKFDHSIQREHPIKIPHKKPRGGELTDQQKAENRELSKSRVLCENAFAGVKRYRAVSEIYRNRKQDFDENLMLTSASLWNFYLEAV